MPQPSQSAVHVDAVLTNISVAYAQQQSAFIAGQVFPTVPVEKQSDLYFTYTKNDWFRDEAKPRADGQESAGSGYGLSTASYAADVFAFHKDVGPQARANADAPLNPDQDATRFVTQRMLLRREVQWAADYFATGKWATDVTPGTLWSDGASDPITDVETGKQTILGTTGFEANTLVLGYTVYRYLKHHPDIVDRIPSVISGAVPSPRLVTPQLLAALFEVDRVLICKAVKATNVEAETAAYAFVQGKHALLAHVATSPGLLTPSAGYMFVWRGLVGSVDGMRINRIPMPWLGIGTERIEGEDAFDAKVVASDLGYFFNSAVA
jgi:hypothetical protein